jgi:hypothetical protein
VAAFMRIAAYDENALNGNYHFDVNWRQNSLMVSLSSASHSLEKAAGRILVLLIILK